MAYSFKPNTTKEEGEPEMSDNNPVKRRSFWLDDADEEALRDLRERYGLETDAAVVRLALRVLHASPKLQIPESPPGFTQPRQPPTGHRRPRPPAEQPPEEEPQS